MTDFLKTVYLHSTGTEERVGRVGFGTERRRSGIGVTVYLFGSA